MIQSVNNEYIKSLTKLKQKKYREEAKQFLAEGEHLVQEAINTHLAVEIFCLVLFIVSILLFNKCLKHYESTGS